MDLKTSVMMEDPSAPGPSRPRRAGVMELSDRIIALQRKNASGLATAGARHGLAGPSRKTELAVDRFDSDFSRGPNTASSSTRGKLYDPMRPTNPTRRIEIIQRPDSDNEFERRPEPSRQVRPPDPARGVPANGRRHDGVSGKKLFDPMIHDPHHFHPAGSDRNGRSGTTGPTRSVLRRPGPENQTPEEMADRERERRRRREGSERGSGSNSTGKKKDADGKSRGSRSSEGSESFKHRERGKGQPDNGIMMVLKDKYKGVTSLEQTLTDMHKKMAANPEAGISVLLEAPVDTYSRVIRTTTDDAVAWMELISTHKRLADAHHEFLILALDPLIPSSLHNLPIKYNIPVRLWQIGYFILLERLRHAWMSNHPAAVDLLTDFIYDAYKFYTQLLDDPILQTFRSAWIEALGDLARYRMAIANQVSFDSPNVPQRVGRIDDDDDDVPQSSGASIGAEVAETWNVEDKETWRTTARDWYAMGITEKPGEGRLHHHLALLCRDRKGEEERALYHFAKSLTASHPFESSRESILPLFDSALQSQRSLPEATALDLFVRLHGMLFTKISLDDFPAVMSRYMERLEEDASLDGVSRKARITQVDWMTMAIVNLSAVLQYGADEGVIRKAFAQEGAARKKQATMTEAEDGGADGNEGLDGDVDENGDGDDQVPADEPAPASQVPTTNAPLSPTYIYALQLAFSVFEIVLSHPNRIQGIHHVLNPYITVFLTFLATAFRQPAVANALDASVPWQKLVDFFNEYSDKLGEVRPETRLVSGILLPEDWTIRGMEWVGRRVYERGFWGKGKNGTGASGGIRNSGSGGPAQPRVGERFNSEMDVLEADFDSSVDVSEGVVDEVEGTDLTDGAVAVGQRRWKRVAWGLGVLVKYVDGLDIGVDGRVVIEGVLKVRLEDAERKAEIEARRLEVIEEERRLNRLRIMDEEIQYAKSDSEDDEDLASLRERKRQLQSLLSAPSTKYKPGRSNGRIKGPEVLQGYTMLVFDTNVLLSSLATFAKIVEGGQWSVIVPLPVVTELDGISKQPPPLGTSAQAAVAYLEKHIRTHSLCLKIQTSKGNYLSDLLIRTEHLNFSSSQIRPNTLTSIPSAESTGNNESTARTMDDLILNIATFQLDHFVDRSSLLGGADINKSGGSGGATKVLLVTFDRNMRIKARSRGIEAIDEKEMIKMIIGKS